MNINEKLNMYVKQNGIKQSYIASKTGLSADTISRILNSNRRVMADEFLNICCVLKIDPNSFRSQSA